MIPVTTETRRDAASPVWEGKFRLVSLKELLMQFTDDEFQFGRIAHVLYFLGRLEAVSQGPPSQKDIIQIRVMAKLCQEDLERFGLRVSARNLQDVIDILNGDHVNPGSFDQYCLIVRTSLMAELESILFRHVEYSVARYYREPRRDWKEVISRFPDAISDIEEAGKCYALERYAASVFHCMQVLEHGLLALGEFMELNDPKAGFTAVANGLQRIVNKKYQDRTDFEKQHYAFFEQMNASVQALKDAWRNKISHAQGKLTVMTADFSPAVTQEIYMATRGFMRRLATDLPKKGRRWPFGSHA